MATIKSYTDISQAKALANILSLESADMHFHYDNDFGELESIPTITEEDDHFILFPKDVRCWSLASLLEQFEDATGLAKEYGLWFCYDNRKSYCTKHYDNPIDACVEMILNLHELKML